MSKHEKRQEKAREIRKYAREAAKTFSRCRPAINMEVKGTTIPPLRKYSGIIHVPVKKKKQPYISSFEIEA